MSVGLQWQAQPNWQWSVTDAYVASFYADDANTSYAGAYNVLSLVSDSQFTLSSGVLHFFVRLDNLLDRLYAGSVIVNNTSAQYFEAGPSRTVLAGLRFDMR